MLWISLTNIYIYILCKCKHKCKTKCKQYTRSPTYIIKSQISFYYSLRYRPFNAPTRTANNISRAEYFPVSFRLQNGDLCITVIHGTVLCRGLFLSLHHVSRIPLWLLCPFDRPLNQMPNLTWALCWPSLWWEALSNLPAGDWLLLSRRGPLSPIALCLCDSVSLGKAPELSGLSVTLLCRRDTASPQHSQGS